MESKPFLCYLRIGGESSYSERVRLELEKKGLVRQVIEKELLKHNFGINEFKYQNSKWPQVLLVNIPMMYASSQENYILFPEASSKFTPETTNIEEEETITKVSSSKDGSKYSGQKLFQIQSDEDVIFSDIDDMMTRSSFDEKYNRINYCEIPENYQKVIDSVFTIKKGSDIIGRATAISSKHFITTFHTVLTVSHEIDEDYYLDYNNISLKSCKMLYPPLVKDCLFTDISIFEVINGNGFTDYLKLFGDKKIELLRPSKFIAKDCLELMVLCHKDDLEYGNNSQFRISHYQDWWNTYESTTDTKPGFCGSLGVIFHKKEPYLFSLHKFGIIHDNDKAKIGGNQN
eukprot:gene6614-10777_t